MSTSTSGNSTRTLSLVRAKRSSVITLGIAAVMLVIAPLGPGWLHVPANPALKTPATTLSFSDLHDFIASGVAPTNALQEAYFSWLAWVLIVLTLLVGVVTVATANRAAAVALAALGFVSLALTALSIKGAMDWGWFFDQVQYIRVGGYLLIVGFVITLILGVVTAARAKG